MDQPFDSPSLNPKFGISYVRAIFTSRIQNRRQPKENISEATNSDAENPKINENDNFKTKNGPS